VEVLAMKRAATIAGLLALSAGLAGAGEMISYKSGADTVGGYLATPSGKGPFPGVIVIQEWWGLDAWVKQQADALAKEGYVALAPDLYRGKVTSKPEEAHQLMSGLSQDRGLQDLKAAYATLAARKDVKADRIGAIGWCMGGRYALLLAAEEPRIKAVVPYYGAPPTDAATLARIKAPVLGNYGGDDKGPAPAQVKDFEAAMKKAGKSVDVKIYEGAPHAFANENNPWGGYRKEAAADAWKRTLAFFDTHLKR
jgi:carboxymethylenebutenolidase